MIAGQLRSPLPCPVSHKSGILRSRHFALSESWAYITLYIVQVALQVSFQVEQEAGDLESDLLSPVVSFGPEFFRG